MKKFLLVLALLFPLASFSQSPVDKSFPPEELFALCSYYYPEQWDSSQWDWKNSFVTVDNVCTYK